MSRSQRAFNQAPSQADAAARLRPAFRRRLQLGGRRIRAWRPTGPRRWGLIRFLLTSYVAAAVTLYLQPGRSDGTLALLPPVVAIAVVGTLLRPVLAGAAVVLNSFGLLLIGIVSQAIILDVAIAIDPNVDIGTHSAVLFVSWPAAVVAGAVTWLLDSGTDETFLAQLLGRAIRVARTQARTGDPPKETEHDGLIVIQFDGVGEDVLRQAMAAGAMPTVSGWLHSQSHTVRGWHTGLPATTPAGQAVLLHGDVTEVPSFRWFEKESGQLMVANHPRDATEVQRRISNGHGLLADRGVSVSNLFSGDAPTRFLTMSDARFPPRSTQRFAAFATTLHRARAFAGGVDERDGHRALSRSASTAAPYATSGPARGGIRSGAGGISSAPRRSHGCDRDRANRAWSSRHLRRLRELRRAGAPRRSEPGGVDGDVGGLRRLGPVLHRRHP